MHGGGEGAPLIDDSAAVHVGAVFDAATATLSAEDAELPQVVVVVVVVAVVVVVYMEVMVAIGCCNLIGLISQVGATTKQVTSKSPVSRQ